jgi:hypothetical protein
MADLIANSGDALSRLIQLQAGRHDLRLNWVGDGSRDLTALCNAYSVQAKLAKNLWTGMRELMQMPELRELPEPLQAQIASIILKAQAITDLETETLAKRIAMTTITKGSL